MRFLRLSIVLLLALLAAPVLRAQWSGSVNVTGGFGAVKSLRGEIFEEEGLPKFIYHELGQSTLRVNYNAPNFQWTSLLEGKVENKSTDNYHIALKTDEKGSVESLDMNAIVKMNEEIPVNAQYRSDISWRPLPGQRFAFWARYNMSFKTSSNLTYRAGMKSQKESLSQEAPETWDHTASAGVRTTHELGIPRRILSTELSFDLNDKQQQTMYTTIGVDPGSAPKEDLHWLTCYILTPHSRSTTYKTVIHYRDSLLNRRPARLMVNPGLRFTAISSLHDNSGYTLDPNSSIENPVWRDSTQIREWFHFASLDFQPYLAADFSWKQLRVHLDYALSFYGRRLTDSTHNQSFKWQNPYVVGNGNIDWRIHPSHKMTLSNKMTLKHPTYLQVCWFDRSGGYIEQLYRGSEALRSTRTEEYKLAYDFNYKRFISTTSFSYSWRFDEIEQTWFKEEIDNRNYKVFTWLNGADSRIQNISQKLGWRGKLITANLGVEYNYTVRTWRDNEKVKKSTDWRLTADIKANLQKGWTLSTDIKYQSAVATFFALFKQYCVLNTKAQKEFKHFILSLEARDLLDMPVEAEYISEDQKEAWTEKTLHNRRLVLLGFSWKF